MIAVSECARNVVCAGGKPLGITNCLNFGNPYDPEVYFQFTEAIRGMGDACRKFETPVTGGNVSFYNQSQDHAVYPTPTIGVIGLIDHVDQRMTSNFKAEGDVIAIIGSPNSSELGGSEYLKAIHNIVAGNAPVLDLDNEKALQDAALELIRKGIIRSAHDISEGGIAVALAECCMMNSQMIGCEVKLPYKNRIDAELFGETQSRIIISFDRNDFDKCQEVCKLYNVTVTLLGEVKGNSIKINEEINIDVNEAAERYYKLFDTIMES